MNKKEKKLTTAVAFGELLDKKCQSWRRLADQKMVRENKTVYGGKTMPMRLFVSLTDESKLDYLQWSIFKDEGIDTRSTSPDRKYALFSWCTETAANGTDVMSYVKNNQVFIPIQVLLKVLGARTEEDKTIRVFFLDEEGSERLQQKK